MKEKTLPTTGPHTQKPYQCTHCGHVRTVGTNHWGEIYSRCPECNWRRPLESTVSVCLEPLPDGYATPTPWKVARLGDLVEILECGTDSPRRTRAPEEP